MLKLKENAEKSLIFDEIYGIIVSATELKLPKYCLNIKKVKEMKKILITGGTRGIGAAAVRKFSMSGDKVAFIYRSSDSTAKAIEDECGAFSIKADLSDVTKSTEATRKAIEYLGGIDVLVNNAGISLVGLFTDMEDDDWFRVLNSNLTASAIVAREAAKEMIRKHSGRIINVGSVWGRVGASCEAAYSASKSGLRGLTFALAKELGPSGITVNCVEPGVINTDMNACFSDEEKRVLIDETPLLRIGEPEDVANLIFFLSSKEASFITGQCIGIDGGFAL